MNLFKNKHSENKDKRKEIWDFKKRIFYVLIFITIAVLFMKYQSGNDNNQYLEFHNNTINGLIIDIKRGSQLSTSFTLNTNKNSYCFWIYIDTNLYSGKKYFYQLAQVGDSISKPAYSDTIYLFRGNKVMPVYFKKDME